MGIYYRKIFNSIICFYVSVITTVMIIFFVYYDAYGSYMTTILKDTTEKAQRYEKLNETAEKGYVVFFGDSITELCDLSTYYPDIKAHNRGISGDTTFGMLARLENNVLNIQPSTIVLLGGTNDLARGSSPQKIAYNIGKIIQNITTALPDCKIIVQSVYPVNPHKKPAFLNAVKTRKNEDIKAINALLPDICAQHGAIYVDMYSQLTDSDGNLKKEYTVDGLHISRQGYLLISKYIGECI